MTGPDMPQAGGSYIRNPDGTLTRAEWTIQPGEPGHAGSSGQAGGPSGADGKTEPPPVPESDAPPAKPRGKRN